jgi:hypothetical protein
MLDSARRVAADANSGSDVIRRAVSTVYYVVFHFIAQSAADCFVDRTNVQTVRYALIYRRFEHTHLKRICPERSTSAHRETVRRTLGRNSVSPGVRQFAARLPELQDAGHIADDNPTETFEATEVALLATSAERAIASFNAGDPDERADVLALIMLRPRD